MFSNIVIYFNILAPSFTFDFSKFYNKNNSFHDSTCKFNGIYVTQIKYLLLSFIKKEAM